jgi:hypothetical protein
VNLLPERVAAFHDFELATLQKPPRFLQVGVAERRQKCNSVNNFIFMPDEPADSTRGRIKTT